jgi:predicted FMN-binding regulatory protein PaiB
MKLSKDKTELIYNDALTLRGIPPEAFAHEQSYDRLGNRSDLEWIIDQYQISTDKRSGSTNDPNREDDPQYILRLIRKVIGVSLATVQLISALNVGQDRSYDQAKTSSKDTSEPEKREFDDFVSLVQAYGFRLERVSGSHHIFKRSDINLTSTFKT